MDVTYWFMFPIAIVIAAVANGAGIGGATFFSPLMLIVFGLSPEVAIGTALITEVFGFTSGVTAHARAQPSTGLWPAVSLCLLPRPGLSALCWRA